jgi:hypothetical protein
VRYGRTGGLICRRQRVDQAKASSVMPMCECKSRSRVSGRSYTAAWCGLAVLAHNLVKITTLAAA